MSGILILDDSEFMRILLRSTLAPIDSEIVAVDSGQEGLKLARSRRFDLIITDVNMPGMSGLEFAAELRADSLCKDSPLFVISAAPSSALLNSGQELNVSVWILKPINPQHVRAAAIKTLASSSDSPCTQPEARKSSVTAGSGPPAAPPGPSPSPTSTAPQGKNEGQAQSAARITVAAHKDSLRDPSTRIPAAVDQLPRILVVDDDENILNSLKRTFYGLYRVDVASSGSEALAALACYTYPVAIVDLKLPVMSGRALLKRMGECAPLTSRIVLSGHIGLESALDAVNCGNAFRILSKPCTQGVVMQATQDALEQYRLVAADQTLNSQRVQELTQQLLDTERTAMLGTVASGIGHELGNIYSALRVSLDMINDEAGNGAPPDPEVLFCLDRVAEHLKVHAEHLHALGCPSQDDCAHADLATEAGLAADMLTKLGLTSGVELLVELPECDAPVNLRSVRIEQIILNLFKNAQDAMKDSGRPSVIRIQVQVDAANRTTTLSIKDNGCGMDNATIERIFEPYFTTKGPQQGTGLGLAMISQIVSDAAGTISVDSVPGESTDFRLTFPLGVQQEAVA